VSVPGIVRKGVPKGAALVKAHVRVPIPESGSRAARLQVAESPKIPAGMVEHAVQHQAHAARAQVPAKFRQVGARTQPAVHFIIVGGVVAVGAGFEHRPEEERVRAQRLDMVQPAVDLAEPRYRRAGKVIGPWRAAGAQGEEVIKEIAAVNVGHGCSVIIPYGIVIQVKK